MTNPFSSSSLSLLVVDDEPPIRTLIGCFFRSKGMRVFEAADGRDALNLVDEKRLRPDCVITDLMMPRVDGLQLLSELRRKLPDLPALVISGFYKDEVTLGQVLNRRTRFLPKPFDLKSLGQSVESLLADTRRASPPPLGSKFPSPSITNRARSQKAEAPQSRRPTR